MLDHKCAEASFGLISVGRHGERMYSHRYLGSLPKLARDCLRKPGSVMELLLMFSFEDDVEAHDDELQSRLGQEFEAEWQNVSVELQREFGRPIIGIYCGEETDWVPLSGVGGVASWAIDERRLWVAFAHEDREVPWLLMVGAIYYTQPTVPPDGPAAASHRQGRG